MDKIGRFVPKGEEQDLLELAKKHVVRSRMLEQRIKADMDELATLTRRAVEILDQLSASGEKS